MTPPIPKDLERQKIKLIELQEDPSSNQLLATSILSSMIRNRDFNHLIAHDLLLSLRAIDRLWPILIDHLLPVTTRINPKPLIAWKAWSRDCPPEHREQLLTTMIALLEKSPDYRMEYWLKKQLS